jgi:hypothetical protein
MRDGGVKNKGEGFGQGGVQVSPEQSIVCSGFVSVTQHQRYLVFLLLLKCPSNANILSSKLCHLECFLFPKEASKSFVSLSDLVSES